MEQFAPYIGVAFVGIGVIGLAVGIWRIVLSYRNSRSQAGQAGVSDP